MIDDPVLRAFRDELAERFKDDPQGFQAWVKEREEQSRREGRKLVSRAPRRVEPERTVSAD